MSLTVFNSFLEQSELRPDHPALIHNGQSISYSELASRVNHLSKYIQSKGVKTNSLIAICTERSIDMICALLAVIQAGGTYIPIDPTQPTSRINMILEDVSPDLIITQKLLSIKHDFTSIARVLLDVEDWSSEVDDSDTIVPNTAGELAYIIFTSGSTGRPKGVEVYHSSLNALLESMSIEPGFTSEDTLLTVTTISFDMAVPELYLPLKNGATMVIMDSQDAKNGELLQNAMMENGVTIFQATPATYQILLESGWSGNKELKLLCGGEAVQKKLADSLQDCCNELWNMYGPTEATVWSTLKKLSVNDERISIGRPIIGTKIYILDDAHNVVNDGQIGELCISGKGLAKGYHGREDLTNASFINIYINGRDTRIYKTGDLARVMSNGELECLGRIDNQVKIRGFRIELGEIETVLEGLTDIKSVVVNAYTNVKGKKSLVAYIIADNNINISIELVRDFLADKLPTYMIPSAVVEVDSFPLNVNNKIDRNMLPAPVFNLVAEDFVAPSNELENKIIESWKDILCINTISTKSNFADIGGDSLNYIRATMELESIIEEIPDKWETISIKELASHKTTKSFMRNSIKWLDTEVILRAVAIVLVVLDGLNILPYLGDSDILFLTAGFTFATYQLKSTLNQDSVRPIVRTFGRIILPSFAFIMLAHLLFGNFDIRTITLIGNYWVPGYANGIGEQWFISVYVQILAILLLLFSFKTVRRFAFTDLYKFTVIIVISSIILKELVHTLWDTNYLYQRVPQHFIGLFLVGWIISLSDSRIRKIISIILLFIVAFRMGGFEKVRIYTIFSSGLFLLYLNKVPIIKPLNKIFYYLAGGSLYIYLTYVISNSVVNHFITSGYPMLNVLVALIGGVIAWLVWERLIEKSLKKIQTKIL